jgi:hypothetical protein
MKISTIYRKRRHLTNGEKEKARETCVFVVVLPPPIRESVCMSVFNIFSIIYNAYALLLISKHTK